MSKAKNKNRLQIVNWREYGDDESFVKIAVFGRDDPGDLVEDIEARRQAQSGGKLPAIDGGELSFYVNDDIVIEDGRIWEALDGKYRIRIEKLPNRQTQAGPPASPQKPPSSLEFFIDPPATGPHAPEGGWLRIERRNPGKPKKTIRLNRADLERLDKALLSYWEQEHRRILGIPEKGD
jgi:hypothetical protein